MLKSAAIQKPPVVLLHGALGSSSQFAPFLPVLADRFTPLAFDFEGHGSGTGSDRPFRIGNFVENLVAFLDQHELQQADLFGCSMGGYVALVFASQFPHRIHRIATLGTKVLWTPETAHKELGMLDPDTIAAKVPAFAQALKQRHTTLGWREVVAYTREMIASLGESNLLTEAVLRSIPAPVQVMVGDQDATVPRQEAEAVSAMIPKAELVVLPDTPHPLEKVSVSVLTAACEWLVSR